MDASKLAVLRELVEMSRRLGEPERDLVILGEGNTSAWVDDDSFFVKASGTQLSNIDETGFVEVDLPAVLELLDRPDATDEEVMEHLRGACIERGNLVPSVETVLHALLLRLPGIRYVAHTHPAAAAAILCSDTPDLLAENRLFPDDIVCCGPKSAFVRYADPGPPLARAVRDAVAEFERTNGYYPKLILMQNHGIIALGRTPKEAEAVTAMHVKACRVVLGAAAVGGARFLRPENVARIATRPDEKIREARIWGATSGGPDGALGGYPATTQLAWFLHGPGIENLGGKDGGPEICPVPEFGPRELLARVDAAGICFSDLKIIRQGGAHPRLYGRDLAVEPIVMGHEVALTVVGVGRELAGEYRVGQRFVVQADIYYKGKGLAFGYMLPGGFEQYVVLGDEVLRGDDGCYLIPIERPTTGHAQAALAEPWACVVRAYRADYRTTFARGGVVWIAGAAMADGRVPALGDAFETPEHPRRIVTTDVSPELEDTVSRKCAAWGAEHVRRDGITAAELAALKTEVAPEGFDDIVLIGCSEPELATAADAALARDGVLALVGPAQPLRARLDIGRVHYDNTMHVGTCEPDIGQAYRCSRTLALKPGGTAWFIGAAGPMGQMHVQLAVEMAEGPALIVGTDIDDARLEHLRSRLARTASAKGIRIELINPRTHPAGQDAVLRELAPGGFDDIIVLAPVAAALEQAWPYLGDGGVMNVFAGFAKGTMAEVDMARFAAGLVRVIGTSGSRPEDLEETLRATESGSLNTNLSVAAVGGIEAVRDGIAATETGKYPGKIVVYPHARLALTGLDELANRAPAVAKKLGPAGEWTVEAEAELLREVAGDV